MPGQTATIGAATPVSVQALAARFVENGAFTYTANFILPQGATLLDVVVEAEAVWTAATSATLNVGDVAQPGGYIAALNLKATDLLVGESVSLASTQTRGGNAGAYTTVGTSTHLGRGYSAASRTITAQVVSVGAGTAGRTRVVVLFAVGSPATVSATP